MPIAVRPDVSEENLRQLLAEGHEYETLDYKRSCDLSNHDELIEIVKDIAAMQILGGYIVTGADNHGNPTDAVSPNHITLFDESRLRAKLRRYISEPFELRTRHHNIDGHDYIVIYVGENPQGFAIFAASGYDKANKLVFREGDVFARHGTASERWNHHDVAAIRRKITERERERWMAEVTEALAKHGSLTGVGATAGFANAITWQLDSATFRNMVIEQLRNNDIIPLKLFLDSIPVEVDALLREADAGEQISVVLDRLTCLAALMLQLGQDDLFRLVFGAFVAIHHAPIDAHGSRKSGLTLEPEMLWFMIQQRLVGVGAFAERLGNWGAVRFIVLQKGRGPDFEYWPNWYRHGLTMAARANLLQQEKDGRTSRSSLLSFAQAQVERLECLHPDLSSTDEEILNSLARFDMLAAVVGISDYGRADDRAFYPNFARYYSSRSTPAVEKLLKDKSMREVLFPQSDQELAQALVGISQLAGSEAHTIAGWDGFHSAEIRGFIDSVLGNN